MSYYKRWEIVLEDKSASAGTDILISDDEMVVFLAKVS